MTTPLDPSDYSVAEVLNSCPDYTDELQLLIAVMHGVFPAPDRCVDETPYWSPATIQGYMHGRAIAEGAAGLDRTVTNFIRGAEVPNDNGT